MARRNDEILTEYDDLGRANRVDLGQFQHLWLELNANLTGRPEQERREVLSELVAFAEPEWFERIERRLQARTSRMTDLTPFVENAPPMDEETMKALETKLRGLGFVVDSEAEESWVRGSDAERRFVMIHRRLALAVTSSAVAASALPAGMGVVRVSGYESEELSMERRCLEPLDWFAELFPEHLHGIDLAVFSAGDLFWATV